MRTPLLPVRRLPPLLAPRCAAPTLVLETTGWEGPGFLASGGVDLSYWDLHGLLLIPTAFLLTAGFPTLLKKGSEPLRRQAAYTYIGFILSIAVAQAFVWDSVGATIGIWEFNDQKVTGLGDSTLLPLEEILWLFHHVIKAALWQVKVCEVPTVAAESLPLPLPPTTLAAGNVLLAAAFVGGAAALLGDVDECKCLGLIAAFFAPVLAVVWNLGARYLRSHWRLFVGGWVVPGWWTVCIDCVGQQQGVWSFPPRYLTGVATLDGLLKLDIAAVYLVSTLAVTATGAIVLAASEEFVALRAQQRQRQRQGQRWQPQAPEPPRPVAASATAAVARAVSTATPAASTPPAALPGPSVATAASAASASSAGLAAEEPGLWELGLFIFDNAAPGVAAPLERAREAAAAGRWWWGDEEDARRRGAGLPAVATRARRAQAEPPLR